MSQAHRIHKIQPTSLQALYGKLPPSDPEAEAALLGSCIIDHNVLDDVAEVLADETDFASERNRTLYTVLLDLHRDGSLDMVQLNTRLKDKGLLQQVGGIDHLVELAESVPSAASASYYARIVRDKATTRRLIDAAGQILHDCYHGGGSASEQVEAAQQAIFGLTADSRQRSARMLNDLMRELLAEMTAQAKLGTLPGIPTGFLELDDILGGMREGQLIVLAGRPGMGKSAAAFNIAEHVAESGLPVGCFSLEMSDKSLAARILAGRSGVPGRIIHNPASAIDDDWRRMDEALDWSENVPLLIADTPGLTLEKLATMGRRMVARDGVKMLVVDYLQIMGTPRGMDLREGVTYLSGGIKRIARELGVPVLLLSQLSRSVEQRESKIPTLADLRESGSIEQDADSVLFLYRHDYYERLKNPGHEPDHGALCVVAKQRSGPTGGVPLWWDGEHTTFRDWPREQPKPGWM